MWVLLLPQVASELGSTYLKSEGEDEAQSLVQNHTGDIELWVPWVHTSWVGIFAHTGALGGSALLESDGALDFVLASGCVFLVKLDGVCSDKSQEVCLEKVKGKISLCSFVGNTLLT